MLKTLRLTAAAPTAVVPPTGIAPRKRLWRRAYEYVAFYGLLASFGILCLLWSVPAALCYPVLPRRIGARIGQFAIMTGFRWFIGMMKLSGIIKCDLSALDALRADGALVICPNHRSLLDAVLVISRLPRVVCITKPSIWDNLFLGGGARMAGYIRNDAPIKLIRSAGQAVSIGQQLLIFPEGTRTIAPPINRFKGGFALIAKAAGAPVQTVFLESNTPFLRKGWPVYKKPEFPLVYRARLGRRFHAVAEVQGFVAELETYFRTELGTELGPEEPPRPSAP
ncbi:MAG TPA: lysophospholipid acyltransferase family protein [Stellaceae bacterium]|nr:lysophospholipid acyltransferase family protein [Stellaceae bacterium]